VGTNTSPQEKKKQSYEILHLAGSSEQYNEPSCCIYGHMETLDLRLEGNSFLLTSEVHTTEIFVALKTES
jgi:hypothetical protein